MTSKKFLNTARTLFFAGVLMAMVGNACAQVGLEARRFEKDVGEDELLTAVPIETSLYSGKLWLSANDLNVFGKLRARTHIGLLFSGYMRLEKGRYYLMGRMTHRGTWFVDLDRSGTFKKFEMGWGNNPEGHMIEVAEDGLYPTVIRFFNSGDNPANRVLNMRWRKLAEDEKASVNAGANNRITNQGKTFWACETLDLAATNSAGKAVFVPRIPDASVPLAATIRPTEIGAYTATIMGNVVSAGKAPAKITAFWGATDGGTNATEWAHSATVTDSATTDGAFFFAPEKLAPDTMYYARFRITDAIGTENWSAQSVSFLTLGTPELEGETVRETSYFGAEIDVNVVRTGYETTFKISYGAKPGEWEYSETLPQKVVAGMNTIKLAELKPERNYFYKLELSGPIGRAAVAGSFRTKGAPVLGKTTSYIVTQGAEIGTEMADAGEGELAITLFWGERDGGNGVWQHTVTNVPHGAGKRVALTGLAQGKTYFYKFVAANAHGADARDGTFATSDYYMWKGDGKQYTNRSWSDTNMWVAGCVPVDGAKVRFSVEGQHSPYVTLDGATAVVARLDFTGNAQQRLRDGRIEVPHVVTRHGSPKFDCDVVLPERTARFVLPTLNDKGEDAGIADWIVTPFTGDLVNAHPDAVLTKVGGHALGIYSNMTFSGELRAHAGSVYIAYSNDFKLDGALPNIASIDIGNLGNWEASQSVLRVRPKAGIDRVNDDAIINLRGGTLGILFTEAEATDETIGALHLFPGRSYLRVAHSADKPGGALVFRDFLRLYPGTLGVFALQEQLGTTAVFKVDDPYELENARIGGIIPYMVGGAHGNDKMNDGGIPSNTGGEMFTYDANGLRMLAPDEYHTESLTNAPSPDANVKVAENQTLAGNVTVNALSMGYRELNATAPSILQVKSGFVSGVRSLHPNISLTTADNNPLYWHTSIAWNNTGFRGALFGAMDFVKAGMSELHFDAAADFTGFTGAVYAQSGLIRVNGHERFVNHNDFFIARRGRVELQRERIGNITGTGQLRANSSLIIGTDGNAGFVDDTVVFNGATLTPHDGIRPGVLRLSTAGKHVRLDAATLDIAIADFDYDQGRMPRIDVRSDEFYDENHSAIYFAGNADVAIGNNLTINVTLENGFTPPPEGARWVIVTGANALTVAGNVVVTGDTTRTWKALPGKTADHRDALILHCEPLVAE